MSPSVLIFVQNIRIHFQRNEDAKKYFIGDIDEEIFFEKLTIISQKNLDTKGSEKLTVEQFEELKMEIQNESPDNKNIYMDFGEYGEICLN